MVKLKEIKLKNRGAFVIDWNGKVHIVHYHGDVFYESGFEKLMQKAQEMVGYNSSEFASMIENGNTELLSLLDDAGCIRGGVWSESKRQLYFTIDKSKATNKAKSKAVDIITEYRPTSIYLEDIQNYHNDGFTAVDEFAGEYL